MLLRVQQIMHLITALFLSLTAGAIELTPEEQTFVQQHPTIVVGGEMDWPPLDFVEDGIYQGAARDYLREIQQRTGLTMTMVTGYSWAELLGMIRKREIDMLPMMYWTNERGREFNMTDPFITVRHYVFVKEGASALQSFEDLYGRSIAIPRGYAHIQYLREQYPQIRTLEVDTTLDTIDAVITGKADALIENTAGIAHQTQRLSIVGLKPAFPIHFASNNVHMAVRGDWPVLRNILQKALDDIPPARVSQIMATWTGSEATARTFLIPSVELSGEENTLLQDRGDLRACVNVSRKPFEFYQDRRHHGITADYLTAISKLLGSRIQAVPAKSWRQIESMLSSGDCDLAPFTLSSKPEDQGLHSSSPFLSEPLALATHAYNGYYPNLSDLQDARLGIVAGYVNTESLQARLPHATIVAFDNLSAALDALLAKELFGVIDFVPTLSHRIQGRYWSKLKISGRYPDLAMDFGVAVNRDDNDLARMVEKALASMPDTQRQNSYQKWIAVSTEILADYRLLSRVATVFALILIALLYLRYLQAARHRREMERKNAELAQINIELEAQKTAALQLAYHDQLTGLSNRTQLLQNLDLMVKRCRRHGGAIALLFLDLDHFKYINDSLGHDIGDQVLQRVAGLLRQQLRDTDILCRVGGDEFIIALDQVTSPFAASQAAQRIIAAIAAPMQVGGHGIAISTSIGIAVFPGDADDITALIKHADAAMYLAKENGRNSYRYYKPELSVRARARQKIEAAMRVALEEGRFRLALQPIVDLGTGTVSGAEALIRWNDPELGVITPDEFIPIAEETRMIADIGEWVLANACEAWLELRNAGLELQSIAINVSSIEFRKPQIAERFRTIMSDKGVQPRHIDIEITERYMLEYGNEDGDELDKLRAAGHGISVDDFGTGYSSLSQLGNLPLNVIKIDRSFVQQIPQNRNSCEITQAIVALAHSLGYQVIAEGVEAEEQLLFLQKLGCDFAQGYFLSRPVFVEAFPGSVEAIHDRLRARTGAPA